MNTNWIYVLLIPSTFIPIAAHATGPLGINWQYRELVASGTTDYQDMAGADRYLAFRNGTTLLAYFNQTEQNIDLHWRDSDFNPGWAGRAIVGNTRPGGTDPGAFPSLAVSSTGKVAVSYITSDGFDDAWATVAVPTGDYSAPWVKEHLHQHDARQTAVAFDSVGRLGLAFHDRNSKKLIYYQYAIGSQSNLDQLASQTVTTTYEDGWWPSLTYYGTAAKIASYNQEQDDVEFQYRLNSGVWYTRIVDSVGFTGARPSIAINPSTGRASIAYYDRDQRDLRYAEEMDNGEWALKTIDSAGNVGEYLSLAFDPSDSRPVIAYTDVTNANLKMAWHDGSTWHREMVDGVGRVGWTPSIAFSGDGRLGIAYMDDNPNGGSLYYIEGVNKIIGDFNGDDFVNKRDLIQWKYGFGKTDATFRDGDANGDGRVDGVDFLIWQRQITNFPNSTVHTPEPHSNALLVFAVLALQAARQRNFIANGL